MKNLSLLVIVVLSFIFIQCEQDTFHQDFDQMLSQEKRAVGTMDTDRLTKAMNEKLSLSIQPTLQGALESRGNTPIYQAETQEVEVEEWYLLSLNKQYMTDTCTFRTVISKVSGNAGLYLFAYDGEAFTLIQGSYDENSSQEEAYASWSDLAAKDTLLVFAVYGYEKSVFDIAIYQECQSPTITASKTVDSKEVATAIASTVLNELRAINRKLEFNRNYTNFLMYGDNEDTTGVSFSVNTNYASISGTKKKDERTHNGSYLTSTYKDETTNLSINFANFSKYGLLQFNNEVKYYQTYDFESKLVYSTGQYASSWKASLSITADALQINYTDPTTQELYEDQFEIEIKSSTRQLNDFRVTMTSKMTGQAFHLYGVN